MHVESLTNLEKDDMDPFTVLTVVEIVAGIAFALWLITTICRVRIARRREHIMHALLRANRTKPFGTADVAFALKVNRSEAWKYIQSLRGDQGWGWAIYNKADEYGHYVIYVSKASLTKTI